MPDGYGSHLEYMSWVAEDADKWQREIKAALRKAFEPFIERRAVEVIVFFEMNIQQLVKAITGHPAVLKSLLAICKITGRAVECDFGNQ